MNGGSLWGSLLSAPFSILSLSCWEVMLVLLGVTNRPVVFSRLSPTCVWPGLGWRQARFWTGLCCAGLYWSGSARHVSVCSLAIYERYALLVSGVRVI
ncbi:hypothetical protein SAMN05216276_108730 [Streptosporangium subroseum]|uniref:Uncharacterized protein n=1 Tax=Streptosporangium subroseum TaxID=106412 RepID=A0A239P4V3_9ACTN|nr:hypothetical protein SAMN05216276_108730 [Streptosporangium subroseum]